MKKYCDSVLHRKFIRILNDALETNTDTDTLRVEIADAEGILVDRIEQIFKLKKEDAHRQAATAITLLNAVRSADQESETSAFAREFIRAAMADIKNEEESGGN